MMSDMSPSRTGHLTSDEVAAYVDARSSTAGRGGIDAHLADCDLCRAEVLEVRSMLKSAPRARRSNGSLRVLAGAAAAALILVALPWRDLRRPSLSPDTGVGTERAVVPDGGRDSVEIVTPTLDGAVAPDRLTITWRRGASDAQFTVTLLNTRGDIQWSAPTRDTVITVPDSVALPPAASYVVYVDALRSDGTSARSAPRMFTIRR
jgi:anti-sigma factor RsiW